MHFDPSKSEEFLVNRQQMHVSILSIGSFAGRLMSGMLQAPPPIPSCGEPVSS